MSCSWLGSIANRYLVSKKAEYGSGAIRAILLIHLVLHIYKEVTQYLPEQHSFLLSMKGVRQSLRKTTWEGHAVRREDKENIWGVNLWVQRLYNLFQYHANDTRLAS
jgi:hypothetical protein